MNLPLVSIMMPVYNGLPLIKASIESIQKQTYNNWECIIVDDGSTDGTSEFLDSISDHRFIVCHLAVNSGRAVARQKCLDMCNGQYICMVDAEDLIHPNKLSKQVEFMEENSEFSLCTSALCSFGSKTDILLVRGAKKQKENVFKGNNHPIHAPSMYRANIAKKCQYNPILRLGEDQDFLEKYLSYNPKFYVFPEIYYYYSELDSVTKKKISRNYFLYIGKYFKQKKIKMSIVFVLKYIYSKLVYPFLSLEYILYKRGRKATQLEASEFNLYCRSIVNKFI